MTATRTWPAPATSRAFPGVPSSGFTVHLIGDTHVGDSRVLTQAPVTGADYDACQPWRYDAISSEFVSHRLPTPHAHIQVGDNTQNGLSTEVPTFLNLMGRFTAPWYAALGNHDLFNQTVAQWASGLGYGSQNYSVDLGTVVLIVVGGDDGSIQTLSTATLTFLDAALSATTKPCFICCHYPIWDTVGGDSSIEYNSTTASFYTNTFAHLGDSTDVRAVIAAHSNVKAWLAGHTHSSVTNPGLVMPLTVGSVKLAAINASSPWYTTKQHFPEGNVRDPVNTSFVTWYDTGRIEVRIRGHNGGGWLAPNGMPVMQVTGL